MDEEVESDPKLQTLLAKTSRTFALSIPLLPRELRRQVTLAYLLFRIADTLEDAERLDKQEKLDALNALSECVSAARAGTPWNADLGLPRAPSDNADYVQLVDQLPYVILKVQEIALEPRQQILSSVATSIAGMSTFVASGSEGGETQLKSVDELRSYCYHVAGLVGEMLTELFVADMPHLATVDGLREEARYFGEGLQLVNILKDADDDAKNGRRFVPLDVATETLFALAREDLGRAERYNVQLRSGGASSGVLAFTELPVKLAWTTLEYVQANGPGSKVPKPELLMIVSKTLASVGLDSMKTSIMRRLFGPSLASDAVTSKEI